METPVIVSVYNDAGVPGDTLVQAERIAARIYEQAGVTVEWVNCPVQVAGPQDPSDCRKAIFPNYLQLRIARRSLSLSDSVFGLSYQSADGRGCYANVFFERVEELHRDFNQSRASLLGHVMAHEIGHLLLGTNSHAAAGLMRAHWDGEDLASASRGALVFGAAESRILREKLSSSVPAPVGDRP